MEKKTYTGRGISKMMDIAKKHGLTSLNSTLVVKDSSDLNSTWTITRF